jgi:hypothetical protein
MERTCRHCGARVSQEGVIYGLITLQARRDGLWIVGLLGLFDDDRHHPHLRRSKLICIGGLVYFFGTCAGWIIYAGRRGIL